MQPLKKTSAIRKTCFVALMSVGLTFLGTRTFAQTSPPQGPPPPPPPSEVFKKINPFKKKNKVTKKDTAKLPAPVVAPGGPPPPPNPLKLFRKKKKDTVKTAPVHQSV